MSDKRIVVSVISDLFTDQRVHKVCSYLHAKGYQVLLIGRCFKNSAPLENRIYRTERIQCFFSRGVLQYIEFNLKLFATLCFKKTDVLLANDLDSLAPNYVHAKLRQKKLVYDSHEYFTGTPELQYKPAKRLIWKTLERMLLPRIKFAYTVNASIANLYKQEMSVSMKVVRNVPLCKQPSLSIETQSFPNDKFILLLQGAGINKDRGADELLDSLLLLPDHFLLVCIGGGDALTYLQTKAHESRLSEKVLFIPKVPFSKLQAYTRQAHLGLSLDKPTCLNYALSLPNKLFDYMHAGIPILASNLVEVKQVIETYNIGMCLSEITPEAIATAIQWIYEHPDVYETWKKNTGLAAPHFCWEREQRILDEIYND